MSEWTTEQDSVVRDKWGKLSAELIAELIPGRTRNAVIGRANRLGLAKPVRVLPTISRRWPQGIGVTNRKSKRKRLRQKKQMAIFQQALFAPDSLKKSIIELGRRECAYIEGDDHLCCGHPSVLETRWCAFHYRVVYRPPENRKTHVAPLAAE